MSQSTIFHFAVLFSTLGATCLAISGYGFDENLLSENTVTNIGFASIICFSLASSILIFMVIKLLFIKYYKMKTKKRVTFNL